MPVDRELAVGADLGELRFTWSSVDVLRYHLALGAGSDPVDERELRYTYERDLQVLPTFATIVRDEQIYAPPTMSIPGVEVDLARIVHGSQALVLHRPIPVDGDVVARTRVVDVLDKGKAAVIVVETAVRDAASRAPMWTSTANVFARGEGGFGGPRGASGRVRLPDRDPDAVVDTPTLPQQALLYRLCGDRNPLHAEPAFARAAGFERPILHGLCVYGMAAKAAADAVLDGDGSRLTSISARFAGIVLPGETLRTRIWRDGSRLLITTCVLDRDGMPVLSDAVVETA